LGRSFFVEATSPEYEPTYARCRRRLIWLTKDALMIAALLKRIEVLVT
jgi:hypothetical protein